MKKVLIGIGAVVVLIVAYWLISPLFIEKQVSETLEDILPAPAPAPEMEQVVAPSEPVAIVLKRGDFTGLAGHSGEGTATLLQIDGKYYVRFEDDFRVTNGPDLFVYFGRDGQYISEARIEKLKGNVGSQNYEVPSGINSLEYNEVWVWCRAFSVPFASAMLN